MPQKLEVWLIRHAESTANTGAWSNKPATVGLSEKGFQQAEAIAAHITVQPDIIIVSPFQRALLSAAPLLKRWPQSLVEIWLIQEFVYLSPKKCWDKAPEVRREMVENYWQQKNPFFCDGADTESFAIFIARLQAFYQRLRALTGFAVIIGHGEFFRAFQLGLMQGFDATSLWMQQFRAMETQCPMLNGEIVKLCIR